jgi:flagellar basal body rod protein FlgG
VQIPALSSALEGMSRAEVQLNKAAVDIARAPVDTVDLSAAMVALLESRNSFEANTRVFKVAADMQKSLLHLIG